MEPCYEYLGCDKMDCIMRTQSVTTRCWEIDGTLCNHPGIEMTRAMMNGTKADACRRVGCIYYKAAQAHGLVEQLNPVA